METLLLILAIIVCGISIVYMLTVVVGKLARLIEVVEGEELEFELDGVECPDCETDIAWHEDEEDVGTCLNCGKTWQNFNTQEEPHLKEVK